MQTGTTPARRIATEPASGRSAPPTGPCRTVPSTGTLGTSSAVTATVSGVGVAA
ncbi:hypothetical protein [Halorubrum lacusprofundi]|uniref:hypothetical protein n=1 Tax=Halorubrum lacusprofundi TaxID=2247 RepID=UPI0012ABD8F2|nr:hypothetical protein [Halorubrum lacusprofundi]MCG1007228.1 hypothetical protein [Halorubrum lacusprofundi]